MLTTNASFDAYHSEATKTPMYLVKFAGVSTHFCNLPPTSPTGTLKQYLVNISGGAQSIQPELGKASIASYAIDILDVNGEVSALLGADAYNWHRKDVEILAGYFGMAEADMLSVGAGAVTDLADKDGSIYSFAVTDVKKWLQKELFSTATEDTPITVQGNVINVMLSLMTSTGTGTNGDYDRYISTDGAGIDESYINISAIENIRDTYYPGNTHYVKIPVTRPIKAKEFIEVELLKAVTNAFLTIDGQGKLSMITYKPVLASADYPLQLTESNIMGVPEWSAGFEQMINHTEFHYNYDYVDDEYDTVAVYLDTDSISHRGPGSTSLKIKSKGLHTSLAPSSMASFAADVIERRRKSILLRFSDPPPNALKVKCFFSSYLSEAGDIADITHSRVPDLTNGSRGITSRRMQIINRTVNWVSGFVQFSCLDTEYGHGQYRGISPAMTVTSGVGGTSFNVSTADAAKYANLASPVVKILDSRMRTRVSNITISNVNTSTGLITTSAMGLTPDAGDFVVYDDYDNATAEQRLWGYISDNSGDLGAANDDEHLIAP